MIAAVGKRDNEAIQEAPNAPTMYTVVPLPDAFTVTRRDRVPVRVALRDGFFEVGCPGRDDIRPEASGLITFSAMVDAVAKGLLTDWSPPKDRPTPTWDIHGWCRKKTARIINKPVHEQWQRLLRKADPRMVAVHQAVFAATMKTAPVTCDPEFYQDQYLVNDVLTYRAAAIATVGWQRMLEPLALRKFHASEEFAAAERLAVELGVTLSAHRQQEIPAGDSGGRSWTRHLPNWQLLFSATGERYRSLSRTLMNLPGGVPAGLVNQLNRVILPRPITKRLELLTVLLATESGSLLGRGHRIQQHLPVLLKANEAQIKEAMHRVARATHNDWSPRRTRDVKFAVSYLLDYPNAHRGNIVGLADKSIRWHRDRHKAEIEDTLERLGADQKTTLPPIPPPDLPRIRLLTTVEEICAEGVDMEHCIASYAEEAVAGNCYLFSVEHRGERASVQINRDTRRVVQAAGPRNRQNGAAKWGQRVLGKWAKGLPQRELPSYEEMCPHGGDRGPDIEIPF
ncbi:PcfJ domain-containing protein [Planctomycetota bacterium]